MRRPSFEELRNALKELVGRPFRASEAHRLPKSVAYVSAALRQVKVKRAKNPRVMADLRPQGPARSRAERDDGPFVTPQGERKAHIFTVAVGARCDQDGAGGRNGRQSHRRRAGAEIQRHQN